MKKKFLNKKFCAFKCLWIVKFKREHLKQNKTKSFTDNYFFNCKIYDQTGKNYIFNGNQNNFKQTAFFYSQLSVKPFKHLYL